MAEDRDPGGCAGQISAATLGQLLTATCALAVEAGSKLMERFGVKPRVTPKADGTPLTQADVEAHEVISRGLNALRPVLPVLSEESGEFAVAERRAWPLYWLVDPMDGTREFIRCSPQFTVNIALISRNAPILGVIHVPPTRTTYYAMQGGGAFRQCGTQPPQAIHVRRTLPGALRVTCSRSRSHVHLGSFLRAVGAQATVERLGSSLKSCQVAAGHADIYPQFSKTYEWDTGAAQCILEEAGGHLVNRAFQPLRYNTREVLMNPPFFAIADLSFPWHRYLPMVTKAPLV